ncbi:hypothetical protein PIROE2DRAFT_8523 [Piromyces sp. E2]|nr:hypothetical protein PIROE2DRAFT_8523 [Piromyces sp. E2]|eukprot:OUM64608.1 hypothetical protein PIROE2DRAFT_8523 [Piromyces sp. E2]
MTISNFEDFENNFFDKLKKESKKSIKCINENRKLIEYNLNEKDLYQVRQFVKKFNDIVLNKAIEKYKLFEEILNHELFTAVLAQFRKSDVLIRACKIVNVNAVKWLLTMNIDLEVQDDECGATALMYAAKCTMLDFALKKMMGINGKHIYLLDNEGSNVVFYAAENLLTFQEFLHYTKKYHFDFNYINKRNENLILYCSRNRKISSQRSRAFIDLLLKYNTEDHNIVNDSGKTAAMYLAEGFRYNELLYYVKKYNIDPNFKTKQGNTIASVFIKKYYELYVNRISDKIFGVYNQIFKKAIITLDCICKLGCDINAPIDEDGTTMLMICSKLHDDVSYKRLVENGAKENDIVIQSKASEKEKYSGVDITNSQIRENIKVSQDWMKTILEDKNSPYHEYMAIYNRMCYYELSTMPGW